MPRYAAIDIGTNAIKFHLAEKKLMGHGLKSSTNPKSPAWEQDYIKRV